MIQIVSGTCKIEIFGQEMDVQGGDEIEVYADPCDTCGTEWSVEVFREGKTIYSSKS